MKVNSVLTRLLQNYHDVILIIFSVGKNQQFQQEKLYIYMLLNDCLEKVYLYHFHWVGSCSTTNRHHSSYFSFALKQDKEIDFV